MTRVPLGVRGGDRQLLTSNSSSFSSVSAFHRSPQSNAALPSRMLASDAGHPSCSGRDIHPVVFQQRQRSRMVSARAALETSATAELSATASSPAASSTHLQEAPMMFLGGQRIHSASRRGLEVMKSLEGWARHDLMSYLRPSDRCWQPSDFLPDPASPEFYDAVTELRQSSQCLPLDYLVVLVGDMVTEEALPSYMNMLNLLDGTKDESGADEHAWAQWTRAWTAEENRHGDLLNKYMYLTGRVDMRQVEVSIQRLIGHGMDPQLENNPYLCFVYTSFQERATKISHANTAKLAHHHGDVSLGRICAAIASDEARHEVAYTQIMKQVLSRDPDGGVLAFADMMKKGIVMPAHFVDDNWHTAANHGQNLFVDYATVADSLGVYTTRDYASIVEHLVNRWDIANVRVESGAAAEAQEYLIHHAARIRRLADIQMERRLRDRKRGKAKLAAFSWVGKHEVALT